MKKSVLWLGLAAMMSIPALSSATEESFTLPAGTELVVRLTTTLSSRATQNGDPWSGRIQEPVFAGGQEVIPAGSIVDGRVTYVKEPGKVKGVGEMRLVAETITTPDEAAKYVIVASLEDAQGAEGAKVKDKEGTIKGSTSRKSDAASVGVGAAAGAGVGAIAAGGKGALYGAGIGAAAMLIRGLFKRGKDVILPAGTELTFVLSRNALAKKAVGQPIETSSQ